MRVYAHADLESERSVLFPTRMMTTSSPLSARTSESHFLVASKEARSGSEWKEELRTCKIIYDHRNTGVTNIARNQASESPMAGQ